MTCSKPKVENSGFVNQSEKYKLACFLHGCTCRTIRTTGFGQFSTVCLLRFSSQNIEWQWAMYP